MSGTDAFRSAARSVAADFRSRAFDDVILVHHNDTDGLTSASIVTTVCERLGRKVRRYCLEKPYLSVLRLLLEDDELTSRTAIVFADLGAGIQKEISRSKAESPIYILDHHVGERASSETLFVLNCRDFEVSGDFECSASGVAFLWAVSIDERNGDLLPLALLGAIGDRQFRNGSFQGLNLELSRLAKPGPLRLENQEVVLPTISSRPASRVSRAVNALGAFGYLKGGSDIAIKGLREGFDDRYFSQAETLEVEFEAEFARWFENSRLMQRGKVSSFSLGNYFASTGVKTVGLVCEKLIDQGIVSGSNYLLGSQSVPPVVPGIGPILDSQRKVSLRVTPELSAAIGDGKALALSSILHSMKGDLSFELDGCHPFAAAVTMSPEMEVDFIRAFEERVS